MWFGLGLAAAAALWLQVWGAARDGREAPFRGSPFPEDGEAVTLAGRVYWKDNSRFYLDDITLLDIGTSEAAGRQQDISLKERFIGESEDFSAQELLLGSRVRVQGKFRAFRAATNPGEFDAAEYYQMLKIGGRLTDVKLLAQGEGFSLLREFLYRQKASFRQRLYRVLPQEEASVMCTVLLGEKEGLDREIKELYRRNGIVHILSISGLHISMIGLGLYKLLRKMGMPPVPAALFGGGFLLLYAMMTGFSVSSCRAVGMYFIRMAAKAAGRTYDMLTAAAVMAAAMALGNPWHLKNSGFLLSFGSILGVGALSPVLAGAGRGQGKARWRNVGGALEKGRRAAGILGEWLRQSIMGGLSIALATLPIQLWFYFEVPTYAIFLNLLVIPLMAPLVLTGIVIMAVPGLGILGAADRAILCGYERLCRLFGAFPFALWNPGRPGVWQVILYYLLLSAAVCLLGRKGFPRRSGEAEHGKGRNWAILTIVVILLPLVFAVKLPHPDTVTFLDVGQGDGICLRTKEGRVYLFDGGSSSYGQVGQYVLKPFLKYHGISYLDGIFLSHPDADHCNGIEELLANREEWGIAVGELFLSPGAGKGHDSVMDSADDGIRAAPNSGADMAGGADGFAGILAAAREGSPIPCTYLYAGDQLVTGGIRMTCLHPEEDSRLEEGNQTSQCFLADFGGATLLLTGDVEKEGEKALLQKMRERGIQDVTVLKAAHHGSANSSSQEFLSQASPRLTVISCGRQNRYGHPHKEMLARVWELGSLTLNTAQQGAVTLEFREGEVEAHTQKGHAQMERIPSEHADS